MSTRRIVALSLFASALAGATVLASRHHASPDGDAVENEAAELRTDGPREAAAFYLQKRLAPEMKELPVERLLAAREQMRSMRQVSSIPAELRRSADGTEAVDALSASWQALGPGNVGGRVMALAMPTGDSNTIYAGTAGGGVWKSTNAGTSWAVLTDTMANLSIASLAIDPANASVIYAGTGEGDFAVDSIRGAGIFKSTDAGANWTRLASTAVSNFNYVNDVRVSRLVSSRVIAATSAGVFTSNDSGATFPQTLSVATNCFYVVSTVVTGVETWLTSCRSGTAPGVYRSTDNGATWTKTLFETGMGRTAIAISGTRAYAAAASTVPGPDRTGDGSGDYIDQLYAFFRSDDGGATWTATVRNTDSHWGPTLIMSGYYNCLTFVGQYGQAWYDSAIAIDPLNPNSVWIGGIQLYRSDDGGTTWGRGPNIHTDHHALLFDPNFNGTTNQNLYIGEDGGIYRSSSARAATGVQPLDPNIGCTAGSVGASSLNNGFAATQFYQGVPYPDGTSYIAGAQDNGTRRGTDAAGPNLWNSLPTCGDGGYNAIDPTNTNTVYASCQGISIQRSTNGGTSFTGATSGIPTGESTIFIPAFTLDPNNNQRLWFGGTHAYRSDNTGTSWTAASGAFANGQVSAIAVAPGNADRVLMGSTQGRVYFSTTATTDTSANAWTVATVNAGGYVSSLAFAPNDPLTVYATIATFGRPHVLKSVDGGATWANISGSGVTGLPDVPALSVVVDVADPTRLFVGTDVGVFTSGDGGATWAVEITGFPNVSTEWLAMTGNASGRKLFAFTHGRGAWRADLGPYVNIGLLFKDGFE